MRAPRRSPRRSTRPAPDAGIERLSWVPGVLGTLADLVEVDDVATTAFAAAIDGLSDVVLVDPHAARAGNRCAARERPRRFGARTAGDRPPPQVVPIVAGTEAFRGFVHTNHAGCSALLDSLLAGVSFVQRPFVDALALTLDAPEPTIVTADGDRFSPFGWRIGATRTSVTRAALDEAPACGRCHHAGRWGPCRTGGGADGSRSGRAELDELHRVVERLADESRRPPAARRDAGPLASIGNERAAVEQELAAVRGELARAANGSRGPRVRARRAGSTRGRPGRSFQ